MKYAALKFDLQIHKKYFVCRKFSFPKFSSFVSPISIKNFPIITRPSELNFFKKIHISEPEHSRILGDLLNPQGSHQQGDIFLRLFFETINFADYKYDSNDCWYVTIESERFDIRIATKSLDKIIIIENKSNWADDQPNQLYRYWYYGIYLPQKRFENTQTR